ncbi:hypothetical protein [Vibrio vulnificus]|uniref:hypothetical protein n=1 Tax=Vibrio vulnificus TaxID=672 RepID=UPI001028FF63|nr:hypothetical protein [Vibrio vulnificus]RZQ00237.1 hypothetical protein D8T54_04115 [Vibrio vulnificus]
MNKELEQAKALREEAREALALAREFNEKSKERQEETTELLKKCRELVGRNNNPPDSVKSRDVFDIVHAINVLAIANTDVIHVFTEFAPHANSFTVNVLEGTQHYNTGEKFTFLLQELVFLNDKKALESLLAIESQVTELIIEAREQAEEKAEVEA